MSTANADDASSIPNAVQERRVILITGLYPRQMRRLKVCAFLYLSFRYAVHYDGPVPHLGPCQLPSISLHLAEIGTFNQRQV